MEPINVTIKPINITINFDKSGSDPGTVPNPSGNDPYSGKPSFIKPVQVEADGDTRPDSLIIVKEPDTKLIFSFANAREGADPKFTGFRYYNTGKDWQEGWFAPGGEGAIEFTTLCISNGGTSMSVIDTAHDSTLYFYVVSWSERCPTCGERVYYCCDPKIKNEPSGSLPLSKG